jgi:hypothetical protein
MAPVMHAGWTWRKSGGASSSSTTRSSSWGLFFELELRRLPALPAAGASATGSSSPLSKKPSLKNS